MLLSLPANFKRKAKSGWKGFRLAISKRSRGFTRQDFVRMLTRLGVELGDTLLVHSALDQFSAFLGKSVDIILSLQEVLGPGGTLLMPTLPFTGSAVEYVRTPRVFDARRTPSQMGLLTELFRRTPGVMRSLHPTHAVAAWGAQARAITEDHHKALTPCGRGTPYMRLLDQRGKILFLGTDIGVMTFFHTVEEVLEPQMPFSPFTEDVFMLESRDAEGHTVVSRTRLFEPQYSRCRNLHKLVPVLKQQGWWREARLGGMKAILLHANQVLEASSALAKRRIYCYDE
jgi:aminoglycoside 3-N-acetyltransferase